MSLPQPHPPLRPQQGQNHPTSHPSPRKTVRLLNNNSSQQELQLPSSLSPTKSVLLPRSISSQNIFHAISGINTATALRGAQRTFEAASSLLSSLPQCWIDPDAGLYQQPPVEASSFSSSSSSLSATISSFVYATYSLPESFLFEIRHRKGMSTTLSPTSSSCALVKLTSNSCENPMVDPLLLEIGTNWNQEFQLALDCCFVTGSSSSSSSIDENQEPRQPQHCRREAGKLLDRLLKHFDDECETTIVPAFVNLMFDPCALKSVADDKGNNNNNLDPSSFRVNNNNNNNVNDNNKGSNGADLDDEPERDSQGRYLKDPLLMKMQKLQQLQREKDKHEQKQEQQQATATGSARIKAANPQSFASLGSFATFNLSQQVREEISAIANPSTTISPSANTNNVKKEQQQQQQQQQKQQQHAASAICGDFELHASLIKSCAPEAIEFIKREIECQRFFLALLLECCFVRPLPITIAPMYLGSYKGHYVLITSTPRLVGGTKKLTQENFPDLAACLGVVCRACGFTNSASLKSAACSIGCDGRIYVTSMIGLLPFLPSPSLGRGSSVSSSLLTKGIMLNSKQTLEYIQFCAENELDQEIWSCSVVANNGNFSPKTRRALQRFVSEKILHPAVSQNVDQKIEKGDEAFLGLKLLALASSKNRSSNASASASASASATSTKIKLLTVEILAQSLSHYFHTAKVSRQVAEKIVMLHGGSLTRLRVPKSSLMVFSSNPQSSSLDDYFYSSNAFRSEVSDELSGTYEGSATGFGASSSPSSASYSWSNNNSLQSIDLVGVVAALFCSLEGQQKLWTSPDASDLPEIVETMFPGSLRAFGLLGVKMNPFELLLHRRLRDGSVGVSPSEAEANSNFKQQLLCRFADLIGVTFAPGVTADGTLEYHFATNSGFERVRTIASTSSVGFDCLSFEALDEKIGSGILVGDFGFQWRFQKFVLDQQQQQQPKIEQTAFTEVEFEREVEEAQQLLLDSRSSSNLSSSSSHLAFESIHLCKYLTSKHCGRNANDDRVKSKCYETCCKILNRILSCSASSLAASSSPRISPRPSFPSYLMILCRHELALCLEQLSRFEEAQTELTRAMTEVSEFNKAQDDSDGLRTLAKQRRKINKKLSNQVDATRKEFEGDEGEVGDDDDDDGEKSSLSSPFSSSSSLISSALVVPILQSSLRVHETLNLMELAEADARTIYSIQSALHHQTTLFECKPFLAKLLLLHHQQQRPPLTPHLAKGVAAGSLGMILASVGRKQEAEKMLTQELISWENVEENQEMIRSLILDDQQAAAQSKLRGNSSRTAAFEDDNNNSNNKNDNNPTDNDLIKMYIQSDQSPNGSTRVADQNDRSSTSTLVSRPPRHQISSLENTLQRLHRLAFPPPHSPVVGSMALVLNNLACLQVSVKKYDEAVLLYQREIKILEEYCKPTTLLEKKQVSQELHLVRMNLATALMHQTQWSKAELLFALSQETMSEEFGERSLQVGEVLLKKVMLYLARVKALNAAIKFCEEQLEVQRRQQKVLIVKDNKDILGSGEPSAVKAAASSANEDQQDVVSGIDARLTTTINSNNNNNNNNSNDNPRDEQSDIQQRQDKLDQQGKKQALVDFAENDHPEDRSDDINIKQDRELKFQLLSKAQVVLEDAFDIFSVINQRTNGKATVEVSGVTVKQLIRRCCLLGVNVAKEDNNNETAVAIWEKRK